MQTQFCIESLALFEPLNPEGLLSVQQSLQDTECAYTHVETAQ